MKVFHWIVVLGLLTIGSALMRKLLIGYNANLNFAVAFLEYIFDVWCFISIGELMTQKLKRKKIWAYLIYPVICNIVIAPFTFLQYKYPSLVIDITSSLATSACLLMLIPLIVMEYTVPIRDLLTWKFACAIPKWVFLLVLVYTLKTTSYIWDQQLSSTSFTKMYLNTGYITILVSSILTAAWKIAWIVGGITAHLRISQR